MKYLPAVALAIFASYFYMLADTPVLRQEWFYVTQGMTCSVLAGYAARKTSHAVAGMALWWLCVEEAQVAVCGIGSYGIPVPAASGLCVERFGPISYAVGMSICVAYLIWKHTCSTRNGRH